MPAQRALCLHVHFAGILSDSFNVLKETSFPCQAVQELTVMKDKTGALQEGPAEFSRDEGRAMVSPPLPQK